MFKDGIIVSVSSQDIIFRVKMILFTLYWSTLRLSNWPLNIKKKKETFCAHVHAHFPLFLLIWRGLSEVSNWWTISKDLKSADFFSPDSNYRPVGVCDVRLGMPDVLEASEENCDWIFLKSRILIEYFIVRHLRCDCAAPTNTLPMFFCWSSTSALTD